MSKTDWARLATQQDSDIDTRDIPELDEDFFRCAERRAPVEPATTVLLDAHVEEWLKRS